MLPNATRIDELPRSERSNPFFGIAELRASALGADDDSFSTGKLFELHDAAVGFVEKTIGNHLVNKMVTDMWEKWRVVRQGKLDDSLQLSAQWVGANIADPTLSYWDADGTKQTVPEDKWHLSLSGEPVVRTDEMPDLYSKESCPVSFEYKFVAPTIPGPVKSAVKLVWKAMFEAEYAGVPMSGMVRKAINPLLVDYYREGGMFWPSR